MDRARDREPVGFVDDFEGHDLRSEVWTTSYLPMWSSRAASAATYEVRDSELHLTIPEDQGLWCPDDHPPLRVSGLQSGVFSGPVGSTIGQQPVRNGALVREEQITQWGWTPSYGLLEIQARMSLTPRSMAAVWMVGCETQPEQSAEICIFEVFGDALQDGTEGPSAAVGMGVHPFRDPAVTEEWEAVRLPLVVTQPHRYAAEWQPGRVDFLVDGAWVKTVEQAPAYPVQLMVAVFDFPEKASGSEPYVVPELVLDYVRGPRSAEPQ
ncbi:MAG: glycoside hydrolase family 16 protein [Propionibacteriaceae bacterium]